MPTPDQARLPSRLLAPRRTRRNPSSTLVVRPAPRVAAIVLAAGRSRRMGAPKLLLPYGGVPIIVHVVREILRARLAAVIVVVRPEQADVVQALKRLPVNFAPNPARDGDMLSSVRCGLQAVPRNCGGVLVALGDQPQIRAAWLRRMVRAFAAGHPIVVPTHRGARGHPLLFARSFAREVKTDFDGVGLRGMLEAHPEQVHLLRVASHEVLADVDTPSDYHRALRQLSSDRAAAARSRSSQEKKSPASRARRMDRMNPEATSLSDSTR